MIVRATQLFAVGLLAAASVQGGDAFDETVHIKLGSALAVAGVVVPGVWWISSWMRGISDRLDLRDVSYAKDMKIITESLENLSSRIDSLPCCGPARFLHQKEHRDVPPECPGSTTT